MFKLAWIASHRDWGFDALALFRLLITPDNPHSLSETIRTTQHGCSINHRWVLWVLDKDKCIWAGVCNRDWLVILVDRLTQIWLTSHYLLFCYRMHRLSKKMKTLQYQSELWWSEQCGVGFLTVVACLCLSLKKNKKYAKKSIWLWRWQEDPPTRLLVHSWAFNRESIANLFSLISSLLLLHRNITYFYPVINGVKKKSAVDSVCDAALGSLLRNCL